MSAIVAAATPALLDQARQLMRAFVAWHRERHREDLALIDEYFDQKAFDDELAALPGKYAPPAGRLVLALADGAAAGCAALRDLGSGACEMKRMFVYPRFHGRGLGRALAEALIRDARAIGYSSMRLDTSARQLEAQGLYRSLGFRDVEPYYALPEKLQRWLVFMELDLLDQGRAG